MIEERAGRHYVHGVSALARQSGITAGMELNAAYALCQTLHTCDHDPARQHHILQELATEALQFSSRVSLCAPAAFLLEVAGSIKYFGSLDTIQQGLAEKIRQRLKCEFEMSISPAPAAQVQPAPSAQAPAPMTADTTARLACMAVARR